MTRLVVRSRGIYSSRHSLFVSAFCIVAATAAKGTEESAAVVEEQVCCGICEKTTFRSRLLPVRGEEDDS